MKETRKIVVKCCECQRELTDSGWLHKGTEPRVDVVYSHGFCPACYDHAIANLEQESRVAIAMEAVV